jgi:hypothetical protein
VTTYDYNATYFVSKLPSFLGRTVLPFRNTITLCEDPQIQSPAYNFSSSQTELVLVMAKTVGIRNGVNIEKLTVAQLTNSSPFVDPDSLRVNKIPPVVSILPHKNPTHADMLGINFNIILLRTLSSTHLTSEF